ncbi:queuosine precursor transporter [Candidatus Saccharibacteria bacterium]|nr:queuosine precursor transporter [Candidatus Saccharibacteria bacterium]
MIRQHQYSLYDIFAVLFVTTLLVSNIISVKIVSVGWLTFDAGTVLFPLAYIVGDIITEVYGYRRTRRLIYSGVAALMLMTLTFWVVQLLPADSSWTGQTAFESTLGVVWRLAIGSVVALFVGEIMNAYVMGRMKVASRGRGLWRRMVSSSLAGNALDTVIFSTIAFAGTMPMTSFWQLIITVFLIKMAVEIMVSPLTMHLITRVKKHEKLDTFEQPAKYLVN